MQRLVFVVVVGFAVMMLPRSIERTNAQAIVGNDFLVTHVRVFDGAATLQDTQVVVVGGVIRAIGGEIAAWSHLRVVDGRGATLVPGLIEAHAHPENAEDLRDALRFGVTTVLDMATLRVSERDLFAVRSAAAVATDVADLRSAGFPATAPGGHGTEYSQKFPTVGTVSEATAFVAARRAQGSDYLKIMLNGLRSSTAGVQNLDKARVTALVDGAHAAGLLAIAHVETLEDVDVALSSGIDGLAHIWRIGGADAGIVRRVAQRRVFVVPALGVTDGMLPGGRESLLTDPRFIRLLSDATKEHLARPFSPKVLSVSVLRSNFDDQLAAVRRLHQAGVTLLAGTDASPGNPTVHGVSLHRELALLNEAGLKPSEALSAATANTAAAFRLSDRGRILPGRRADMLLVRGDPTSDLFALRDIVEVWKEGVRVERAVTKH